MSAPVLGIDFGTTNSVCAVQVGDEVDVLPNANNSTITPSVVYYTQEHEQNRPLVGEAAENKARQNPERVVRSIKRLMGESDTITVGDETYNVPEVGSEILRKIRTDAADALDIDRDELTDVVITRPAYWEEDRTNAIHQAAEMAGFTSVRLIKEPAAAAIAYGQYRPDVEKTIGVYDLGGGTFDFAIVDISIESATPGTTGTSREEYSVIAQSGDPQLGGDDWDERIVTWVQDWVESEHGIDPFEPHNSDDTEFDHLVRRERVRAEARQAKETLSDPATTETDLTIPFFMEMSDTTISIEKTLTESEFRSMTRDLVEQTIDPMHTALDDADISKSDLDDVILVGGSTKMPQVQELIHAELETQPTYDVDPSEAVAIGAGIHGNRDDILLLEVTPLSLGIGIKGDRFKKMIERNTRLPAKRSEVFTPSQDGQTAVRIPIYQGEREIASENRHLKTLILEGLTPGRKQSAQVKVTFEVQKNGIINVRAVENTDNRSVSVEIEGENRLPDEYVDEKVKEAREMEEMDKRRQRVIEAQNEAESAIDDARDVLQRFPHIIDEDEERNIRNHISHVESIRNDDTATVGDLREAVHDLNEWVLEIGDRARQQGVSAQQGPKEAPQVDTGQPIETDDTEAIDTPQEPDDIKTDADWDTDSTVETKSLDESEDDQETESDNTGVSIEGYVSGDEETDVVTTESDSNEQDTASGAALGEEHVTDDDDNAEFVGDFGAFDNTTEAETEDSDDTVATEQRTAFSQDDGSSGGDDTSDDDSDETQDTASSDDTEADTTHETTTEENRDGFDDETEQGTLDEGETDDDNEDLDHFVVGGGEEDTDNNDTNNDETETEQAGLDFTNDNEE